MGPELRKRHAEMVSRTKPENKDSSDVSPAMGKASEEGKPSAAPTLKRCRSAYSWLFSQLSVRALHRASLDPSR